MDNIQDRYTSLEFSRKISKKLEEIGCELESEYCYCGSKEYNYIISNAARREQNEIADYDIDEAPEYWVSDCYDIMWDIAIVHAKKFFGEKPTWDEERSDSDMYPAYIYHSEAILHMLQEGNKEGVEAYIEKHSTLFSKKERG